MQNKSVLRVGRIILWSILIAVFMTSSLGNIQSVKGLGSAPVSDSNQKAFELLSSAVCEVSPGQSLQAAISDSNCSTIIVQPGNYPGYYPVKRDNVTLQCAENRKCSLGSIDVYGDNVVINGFVLSSKDYKTGIRNYGDNNLIVNNEIYHMKEDCIWVWGRNVTIRGNYCHDILHPDLPQYPEYDQHVDCYMTWAWDWDGTIDYVDNIIFENNICNHNRPSGSNQFFILTHNNNNVPIKNIIFRNNIFISADAGYMPLAFYGDSSVTGIQIVNNTFYNTSGNGANPVYVSNMPDVYVANNVSIGYTGGFVSGSSAVQANNIMQPPYGMQNIQGLDFRLLSDSPLIDAGVASGIKYDYDGNLRDEKPDTGAFEYIKSIPPTETPSPTPTPIPTNVNASSPLPGFAWEAEQGQITHPFVVANGTVSQNVLTVNPLDGGQALYRFTVQEAGDYIVKAVVNAADAGSNSFFVGMDSEPDTAMIWDVPLTNGFEARTVSLREGISPDGSDQKSKIFNLGPGEHILIIRGREIGTTLDKVEVAKAVTVQPTTTATPTVTFTQMPTNTPEVTISPTIANNHTLTPPATFGLPTIAATETPALASPTFTVTSVPPTVAATETSIPASPLLTATSVPPTIAAIETSILASPTPTATSILPTVVVTETSIPASPTFTATSVPPTVAATETSIPASPTFTATSIPPTVTATATSVPASPTPTVVPTSQPSSKMILDDKDSSFIYSPGWENLSKKNAYEDSFKLTYRDGAFVTFNFTGQSFSILYKSGWNYATMDVYVDNVKVGTINQKEMGQTYQKSWDYPGQLAYGTHTLKLIFISTGKRSRGSLDAVIVR